MKTTHKIYSEDARGLNDIADNSVELVVTSPPYPMIEMWDEMFDELVDEPLIDMISQGNKQAYELMHRILNGVWKELPRVLADGGIVCINIGNATRTLGDEFQLFSNKSYIVDIFTQMGFTQLPGIVWRKQANKSTKFFGSGTLPVNAYVTNEKEHILVFRNGEKRNFSDGEKRRESSFFYHERNKWFSDIWNDIGGVNQELANDSTRERSGAYPIEIPRRLIQMYSIYGDTVLDPFSGIGTTTVASALSGRNSVGYEIDESLISKSFERLEGLKSVSEKIIKNRLESHNKFIQNNSANYDMKYYDSRCIMSYTKHMKNYLINNIKTDRDRNISTVEYNPHIQQ